MLRCSLFRLLDLRHFLLRRQELGSDLADWVSLREKLISIKLNGLSAQLLEIKNNISQRYVKIASSQFRSNTHATFDPPIFSNNFDLHLATFRERLPEREAELAVFRNVIDWLSSQPSISYSRDIVPDPANRYIMGFSISDEIAKGVML